MYDSIRIQNFRGIKDLEIKNLGRVNLLVGANNVGKSSVLEAIALLNSENDPALLLEMAEARGFAVEQMSPDLLISTIRDQNSIWLPRIEALDSGIRNIVVFALPAGADPLPRGLESDEEPETTYEITAMDSRQELSSQITLTFGRTAGHTLNEHFHQKLTLKMQANWREVNERAFDPPLPAIWMPSTRMLSPIELSERFAALKDNRTEGVLLGALRRLDPRVQEVYLAFNRYGFNDVRPLVHVHLADLAKAIPLRMLGGGASRLMDMLVSLPLVTNGVFLADEIENGIFHDNLGSLWDAVNAGSTAAKAQIFATTHSWECVTAAVEAFRSDPEAFRMFRLSRIDGELRAVPYEHEVALAATSNRFEVR